MRKKPLLVVMFQIPDQANGGVNSLVEVISRLEIFQPTVLTQLETPVNAKLRQSGVEVIVGPLSKTGSGLLPKIQFSVWLWKLLGERKFVVAHVNDMQAYLHAQSALYLRRIPMVFNVRGIFAAGRKYGFHWSTLRLANKVVVLSNEMKSALIDRLPIHQNFLRNNFIEHIYSIVDFERFKPAAAPEKASLRSKLNLDADKTYILYVARFDAKKLQLPFIEQTLPKLPTNTTVLFLGDYHPAKNDYAAQCAAALAQRSELSNYRFVGYTDRPEDYYRAANLVIIPSLREGLARCMIEGLASGLPVVSFVVSSAREILEQHHCGKVVEQGNFPALLEAINDLLGNETLYDTYANNGVTVARKLFAREKAVAAYEAIYGEVANER